MLDTNVNVIKPVQRKRQLVPIIALFTGNAISMLGNVLAVVAIPWFVLQTTGSASKTGLAAFFTILPRVIAAFLGGALVDRLGYKRTSILADCASTVAIALIPFIYTNWGLEFWQLLALVFLGNVLDAPGTTAREAIVPDLAALAGLSLETASTSGQVIERSSRLVGAPLAGALIALVGASQILWIDAATFAISAGLIAFLVPSSPISKSSTATASESIWSELVAGFRFIWHDKLIRLIVGVVMLTNLLDAALGGVILPVYINRFFGDALDLGLLIAVGGGAAVVGALAFGFWGKHLSRRVIFAAGFVIVGLRFAIMIFILPFWLLLLLSFIAGLGSGPLNPIIGAITYQCVPAVVRGRVFGAISAGVNVGSPLGVILAGFLLEQLDIRILLAIMGVIYVVVTGSSFFSRAWHEDSSAASASA
jgi:MFS family permease